MSGRLYNLLLVGITPSHGRFYPTDTSIVTKYMAVGYPSTPLLILLAWYSIIIFGFLRGFTYSSRGRFCWGPPVPWSALCTLLNVSTHSYMILFIFSYRASIISWVVPFIITVRYTHFLGVSPHPVIHQQNCLVMVWVQLGTVTRQLPSNL